MCFISSINENNFQSEKNLFFLNKNKQTITRLIVSYHSHYYDYVVVWMRFGKCFLIDLCYIE